MRSGRAIGSASSCRRSRTSRWSRFELVVRVGGLLLIPASAFSHFAVGGALATLAPSSLKLGRLALVLGAAAAMPDLDVLAFRLGIPYGDPLGHRGFSHSLLFAALLAPMFAILCGARPRTSIRAYWWVLGIAFLAIASHGLLDALTDAGLGVGFFIPFDNERFFFAWRPIMTSPIGFEAFFRHRGFEILANEFVWIVAPALLCAGVVRVATLRRKGKQRDGR